MGSLENFDLGKSWKVGADRERTGVLWADVERCL